MDIQLLDAKVDIVSLLFVDAIVKEGMTSCRFGDNVLVDAINEAQKRPI
jgi:hypothetical protein